jgi:hypothetical protein
MEPEGPQEDLRRKVRRRVFQLMIKIVKRFALLSDTRLDVGYCLKTRRPFGLEPDWLDFSGGGGRRELLRASMLCDPTPWVRRGLAKGLAHAAPGRVPTQR